MATLRTLSVSKQLTTTWCKRKYAFVCSTYKTGTSRGAENGNEIRKPQSDTRPNVSRKPYKIPQLYPTSSPIEWTEDEREKGLGDLEELDQDALKKILAQFTSNSEVWKLCVEHDIAYGMYRVTHRSFSAMCLNEKLSPDLHLLLLDLIDGSGDVVSLFPHFLKFSLELYPHLGCMDELKSIADLTSPAKWYPDARKKTRNIIIHTGPTNSGKTHQAMNKFLEAESAIYCCPLRLLAIEICNRSNDQGIPCDLRTGELITFANESNKPGSHMVCTVEMAIVEDHYNVAVIDEVQLIRDIDRGWAWTRAFLGLNADEIHLCGEESAIPLIKNLAKLTGDNVEVKEYERLTSLKILDEAVERWENILPGDCIICFSKESIFKVSTILNKLGIQTAIIYGHLPPATKIAMANKFNDPLDPCKVLVATDAVGMGVNLNIRRIVFHQLHKKVSIKNGQTAFRAISASMAKHIAGRAGRFKTIYPDGEVTTFLKSDIPLLHNTVGAKVPPIQSAGLKPTTEQMEMFSYQLPNATLEELLNTFEEMAKHDEKNFFMCELHQMKVLAGMIDDIGLPMRDRFHYSTAPIDIENELQCEVFVECAKKHYNEEPISLTWLTNLLGWPLKMPKTPSALRDLESIFGCLDNYLWFSKYYPDIYQGDKRVLAIQKELEIWIEDGLVLCLLRKLNNAEKIQLETHPLERRELTDKSDKLKHEKLEIEETELPLSTDENSTNQSQSISGMITFLKKGGISEKRLKKLSKKLDIDVTYSVPASQIGKHPRKEKVNIKNSIKNLGKILKDKKK
ncbi:ATP-dependent RNA helicase SUV3 homolog, mitochondrial-like [Pecten maximus]|uniref:ATP-dependent RNA helicase SUV3 homolog, mitochondrial-like n=1 Tax=Pecten maximus TaxID=6579 RepID=UPI00145831F9|nr:ATP-dependent RNA helicase SUV3 homolog, mitochondrial-like [Pecten maximus]